jgi:hypothetical protein
MNDRKREGSQKCVVAPVKAESFEKGNGHESRYRVTRMKYSSFPMNGTDGGTNL